MSAKSSYDVGIAKSDVKAQMKAADAKEKCKAYSGGTKDICLDKVQLSFGK